MYNKRVKVIQYGCGSLKRDVKVAEKKRAEQTSLKGGKKEKN